MYRSWKNLLVTSDEDLRSLDRIRKLAKERAHASYLTVIAFIIAGALCFGVAAMLVVTKGFLPSVVMLMMAAGCFLAAKLFHREVQLDTLRCFLKNPSEFEFAKGQLLSASFSQDSNNRRNSRMLVKGEAKTLEGEPLLFFESFHPEIWSHVRDEEAPHIKPVKVHVIYDKRHRHAALIGIDKELVDEKVGSRFCYKPDSVHNTRSHK